MGLNKTIVRRPPVAVPDDFPAELPPVLARAYAARQVSSARELDQSASALLPFSTLKGIDAATALLERALKEGWRVLVVGDFDADGATSTAVAVEGLRALGCETVDFLVPNRFEFGYGLTPEIVEVAATRNPDLIVTVDNGISSHAGVAAAVQRGMRVLVTDHHLPAETLPEADAIVNPNQPGCGFESKTLAGVGVAFYLMLALRTRLREAGWFDEPGIAEPNLASLLDLVALGTVADVVPLDANNRILVAQGVARIRSGRVRPGIEALIDVARRQPNQLVSSDLGFALGPRLNAAGRLDDMSIGIRCLLADDIERARALAAQLDGFNRERRAIETQMHQSALTELDDLQEREELPPALCLYRPDWHEGVIGILASRVKDRFHRPVIVFTDASEGEIKGSARSVPGLHIRDALDAVAARHSGLLVKFGGHAMAAGLTLRQGDYERFRHAFVEEAARWLSEEDLRGVIVSDGPLNGEEVTFDLAQQLRFGGPWGQGFSEPLYDAVFELVQQRVVGERHLKLLLRWEDTGQLIDAIAFNHPAEGWLERATRVRAAFRLDINEFRGRTSVQLVVEHIEPVANSRNK